jgi:carboxyl-terminal processing protease
MKPLLFIFLLICNALTGQPALQQKVMVLNIMLQKNHFNPAIVNDDFSARVFDHLIKEIDEDKLYLNQQDIEKLTAWRLKIDDEMTGKSWGFVNQLTTTYKAALNRADSMVQLIFQQPVNLDKPDFFTSNKNTAYPENGAAWQLRWNQYLRSEILDNIYDAHEDDSIKLTKQIVLKEEPTEIKKIAASFKRHIAQILSEPNAIEDLVDELYLNSIATCFDPHTEFFPPEEKKDFEESLSSQNMKYGFGLQETDEGEYLITSLMPGSPAWTCGSIHVNDKLIALKPGNGAIISMDHANRHQLDSALDNVNQQLEMTVQSADGKVNTVKLQKEMVNNEENIVKGYILEYNGKKTGYISLPSFYTGWDDDEGSSCANDVAKEIVKLKKDGIDALLLDLRYNGGGSVQEAVELSGIFIDAGPLSLLKYKDGKIIILKDPARGTIYDGPLGVMINGQSASASELVAGALQDYNRAVIIGSNSFGKATMQQVLPMDTSFDSQKESANKIIDEKNGFVKITLGKLYRITGNTNQLNGVAPDVSLPDAIEGIDYTERTMPFALPSDTVMKRVIYTPLKPLPIAQLAAQSKERVATSAYFNDIKKITAALKNSNETGSIPLQWENYMHWRDEASINSDQPKNNKAVSFSVVNSAFDNKLLELNAYQKEMGAYVKKDIADDAYIEEALRVMSDLIQLK